MNHLLKIFHGLLNVEWIDGCVECKVDQCAFSFLQKEVLGGGVK